MCKMCDKVKNVPSDKKSYVKLFDWQKGRDKLNDAEYFEMEMGVNHEEYTKEPYATIRAELKIESTELVYGNSVYIKYCPFCGDKLY